MFAAAERFPNVDFVIVLGKLNVGLREKFESLPNVSCHDFLPQSRMAEAYANSDLVVTRAGATTLAEIEASGTPMVIVPLEGSANDHQKANAAAYAKKGNAVVFEKDLPKLSDSIGEILSAVSRTDAASSEKKSPAPEGGGISKVVERLLRP